MFYAKRLVIGAKDRGNKPLPDCVIVTAFPSQNNQKAYIERHATAAALSGGDGLVIKAKRAGLRDDYHSVQLPISEVEPSGEDIIRAIEPEEPEESEPEDVEDEPVAEEPEEEEIITQPEPTIEPIVQEKPKKKFKRKRGRPKKKQGI